MPFHESSFDAIVGAFVLNHVPDLVRALAEARRVTRAPGVIVASTFSTTRQHPAKDAIGSVVDAAGYVPPDWFLTFKAEREPLSGGVDALRNAATSAGFVEIDAFDVDVDLSTVGAEGLADYRLGMAHLQPFFDALDASRRDEVRAAAISAAAPFLAVPMPMLVLVARVQG